MLCRFPEGIREYVGLFVGKAGIGQATGDRVGIEHEVMLPRSYRARCPAYNAAGMRSMAITLVIVQATRMMPV